jgi:AcrR family transcriptional regulator
MASLYTTNRMVGSRSKKPRDAEATKARILAAATAEFARSGFAGARVDRIARAAKANKQMIYHYFGSKERLFAAVLEAAYAGIRAGESALDLDRLDPVEALETLVEFTWNYYLKHPGFITLVNSENLHKARHIKNSKTVHEISRPFVARMARILQRGAAAGLFRKGIDPVQLHITIAAIGYYYFTNRYTGAVVFERDFMTDKALRDRLAFNLETVRRLVCTPAALTKLARAA